MNWRWCGRKLSGSVLGTSLAIAWTNGGKPHKALVRAVGISSESRTLTPPKYGTITTEHPVKWKRIFTEKLIRYNDFCKKKRKRTFEAFVRLVCWPAMGCSRLPTLRGSFGRRNVGNQLQRLPRNVAEERRHNGIFSRAWNVAAITLPLCLTKHHDIYWCVWECLL